MKTKCFFLFVFLSISFTSLAQNDKIGYVNVNEVFTLWPEKKKASNQLTEYENQLQKALQAKIKDFQTKVTNYNNNAANMDAITRKDTETELQNLQSQIQQFEANAEQAILKKNEELMNPLREKLKNAITTVGRENNFTFLLEEGSAVLYASDRSKDVSSKVAQKLGFVLNE